MNWEDSKACTPLKRDFLRAWFSQEQRFFLTGGSALGLFYLDHRRSYDLDLFTSEEVAGKEVQSLVNRVATQIGAECAALRTSPDFHRFRLVRGEEREIIDVVVDRAPQLDVEKASFGGIRVDTISQKLIFRFQTSEAALLGLHADHEIHGWHGPDERISGGDAGGEFPGGRARRDR
jgi:hypothetical protein